jgi:hypothetical protein
MWASGIGYWADGLAHVPTKLENRYTNLNRKLDWINLAI